MISYIDNVFCAILNTAIQALAFSFMLPPVRGRLLTVLICTAVMSAVQLLFDSLMPSLSPCWAVANPAAPVLLAVLFRGRWYQLAGVFCLVSLTAVAAGELLLPLQQIHSVPLYWTTETVSLRFRFSYVLTFFTLLAIDVLLLRLAVKSKIGGRTALIGFACGQALAQIIILFVMLQLTNVSLDRTTLVTLWLINCCSLCMMAASLTVVLRESRDASLLKEAELSAKMQRQALARVATCEEDAAQIRASVLSQLEELENRILTGEGDFPAAARFKTPLQYSPSRALNTLLEHKHAQAADLGIQLMCRGLLQIPVLSEFALCTIVANMLDNALASAAQQDPWVRLECLKRGGIRSLVCSNSTQPQPASKQRPLSERQGLGLSIIRATTLDAGGRMYLQSTADTFSVILSFSEADAAL